MTCARTLAALMTWSLTLASPSATARAGGEFERDEGGARAAHRVASLLRTNLSKALHVLCRDDASNSATDIARTVIVERAATVTPKLLEYISKALAMSVEERNQAQLCDFRAAEVLREAVCHGQDRYDLYEVDRRSEAQVNQARMQTRRALVTALESGGSRGRAALAFVATMEKCEWHTGDELVKLATPTLVHLLRQPDSSQQALAALSLTGADKMAAPALHPFLADARTLPFAARGLTRMGEDVSSEVPRLAQLLTTSDRLVVIETLIPTSMVVTDTLSAMKSKARAALPRLAALARSLDSRCEGPVSAQVIVDTVAAIAGMPEDQGHAIEALVPLFHCDHSMVAATLSKLGDPGLAAVLAYFRDDRQYVIRRLEALFHVPESELAQSDRVLRERLQAKWNRFAPMPQGQAAPPPRATTIEGLVDHTPRARTSFTACRAEAGLPPTWLPNLVTSADSELSSCLDHHLCGPSESTYQVALETCCKEAFGQATPDFCRSSKAPQRNP